MSFARARSGQSSSNACVAAASGLNCSQSAGAELLSLPLWRRPKCHIARSRTQRRGGPHPLQRPFFSPQGVSTEQAQGSYGWAGVLPGFARQNALAAMQEPRLPAEIQGRWIPEAGLQAAMQERQARSVSSTPTA